MTNDESNVGNRGPANPADDRELAEAAATGTRVIDVHGLLARLEQLVDRPTSGAVHAVEGQVGAAWRRATREEPRVQVTIGVVVAIALMLALPTRVASHPRWVLPGVAVVLLLAVFVAKSGRLQRRAALVRAVSLALIGVLSLSNATSAGRLIVDLVRGEGVRDPAQLLLTGAAIWLTNVIVFGLWYWEFDRGGPIARAAATQPYPDFVFPQMTSPELAFPDWEPGFVDYVYVSFTNALAFSPTDTMPMTRWAKLTMLAQSLISVVTVALVIARAVNILK